MQTIETIKKTQKSNSRKMIYTKYMIILGSSKNTQQTFFVGSREKAEASFGLERIRWQTWFHDVLTQAGKLHIQMINLALFSICFEQVMDSNVRTMDTTYLHIGMILSTLDLSPHGFALGLYPKGLIPMEIFVHPYIPMILFISNQCGTLVAYPTSKT
jgi:hypothetical protein